jgi:hypothetical protein
MPLASCWRGGVRESACRKDAGEVPQQLPQAQRAELEDALVRVLRDGEDLSLAEGRPPVVGHDGVSYRVDRIVPLWDAQGSPAGATLVFRRAGGGASRHRLPCRSPGTRSRTSARVP